MFFLEGNPLPVVALLERLQEVLPSLADVAASEVFCVDETLPSHPDAVRSLAHALDARQPGFSNYALAKQFFLVLPKRGYQSVWSEETEQVLQEAGFDWVRRIECARLFQFTSSTASALTDAEMERIAPLLHDAETETIVSCFEDVTMVME